MKLVLKFIILIFLIFSVGLSGKSQNEKWTLSKCIDYALSNNIDVQKLNQELDQKELNSSQIKATRLPNLSASVSSNQSWSKQYNSTTQEYGQFGGSSSMSYGISSGVTLFNGFKINNQIEQSDIEIQMEEYYSETIKESIELSILNAYMEILYAQEELANSEKQIEATEGELKLAQEKLELGIISKYDYLQIKSELATEKLTSANAKSTLIMAKVNLMQIMELPVTDNFEIEIPDLDMQLVANTVSGANLVYEEALKSKPQIKEAELMLQSVLLDEKIARADLYPSLSMNASFGTDWSNSITNFNYTEQLSNQMSPSLGLSLSIPIFQNKQVKTNIELAKISYNIAKLEETETKNSLRKEVEQAVTDLTTAQVKYDATQEQYDAIKESYNVAEEKYELGLINSIDFLIIKNDLIISESNLLQAKYNLIFSNKIVDYYNGKSITLSN